MVVGNDVAQTLRSQRVAPLRGNPSTSWARGEVAICSARRTANGRGGRAAPLVGQDRCGSRASRAPWSQTVDFMDRLTAKRRPTDAGRRERRIRDTSELSSHDSRYAAETNRATDIAAIVVPDHGEGRSCRRSSSFRSSAVSVNVVRGRNRAVACCPILERHGGAVGAAQVLERVDRDSVDQAGSGGHREAHDRAVERRPKIPRRASPVALADPVYRPTSARRTRVPASRGILRRPA